MKKLFRGFVVAMLALVLAACHEHPMYAQDKADGGRLAGKWSMTMDTPHGKMKGDLKLNQEGNKLSGSITVEHMGEMSFTGTVDGSKITMSMQVPGGDQKFGFTGTVDGDRMSGTTELGGAWTASR